MMRRSGKQPKAAERAGTRGVAHDLANEVAGMVRLAELALDRLPDGHPARGDVEALRRAGLHCSALVRELLGRPPDSGPADLAALAVQQVAMFRRLHGGRIRFDLRSDPAPLRVRLTVAAARRVLDNLILNAIEAMPEGGELAVRVRRGPGERITFTVRDSGHGMDRETIARAFEPAFTTRAGGSGLGLSVTKRIVEEGGGKIGIASEHGRGTSLSVVLPAFRDRPVRARTILLVDDQRLVRSSVRQVLESSGYTVLEAGGGKEALALLGGTVDLLLTDLNLPDTDGVTLARAAQRAQPGLKVVYLSGDSEADGAGVEYLAKPVAPEELRQRIRAVLDGPARGR